MRKLVVLGDFLTVKDFARHTGATEAAVRKQIERGKIKCLANGWRVLIPASELARWR